MKKFICAIFVSIPLMFSQAAEKSFIYSTNMPKDTKNPCTNSLNYFLAHAVRGQLKKTMVRHNYLNSDKFPLWAIWGYCCPDSTFHKNEKMLTMLKKWITNFVAECEKNPGKKFSGGELAMALYELKLRPEIEKKLEPVSFSKFKDIIKKKLKRNVKDTAGRMPGSLKMVNIPLHSFKELLFSKLLYDDKVAEQCIVSIFRQMLKIQMPNGMFPYRHKLDSPKHLEFETMYYRAIENQALYLYWYATASKLAETLMKKGAPYYSLSMELPYFYNGSADPWWKVQYRTFWPDHVAMSAVVSKNLEVAWIALEMGRDNISRDRFSLVAGSLAYRQMANMDLSNAKAKDKFLIADPDIRGVRLRNKYWSSTFNTMSYTTTRMAVMSSNKKSFDAMIMARPYIRINPLEMKSRYDNAYCISGSDGAYGSYAISGKSAAVFSKYRPMLTGTTWKKKKLFAPCEIQELWIMTPGGTAGIICSKLVADMKAYEFLYEFRFIIHNKEGIIASDKNLWKCGSINLKIWETNFSNNVIERDRQFALNPNDHRAWQIALTDEKRPPREIALKSSKGASGALKEQTFSKGLSRFALVSIAADTKSFRNVKLVKHAKLIILKINCSAGQLLAIANPSAQAVMYKGKSIKSGTVVIAE